MQSRQTTMVPPRVIIVNLFVVPLGEATVNRIAANARPQKPRKPNNRYRQVCLTVTSSHRGQIAVGSSRAAFAGVFAVGMELGTAQRSRQDTNRYSTDWIAGKCSAAFNMNPHPLLRVGLRRNPFPCLVRVIMSSSNKSRFDGPQRAEPSKISYVEPQRSAACPGEPFFKTNLHDNGLARRSLGRPEFRRDVVGRSRSQ